MENDNNENSDSLRCSTAHYREHGELNGWTICQVTRVDSWHNCMWFGSRALPDAWCEIRQGFYADSEYIHEDGVARDSTVHEGKYTGYFESKEAVEAVIRR